MNTDKLYIWSSEHAQILSQLFIEFNRKGISYFVLRNHEGLPEVNYSKDVDIIIQPRKYAKARQILLEIFRRNELSHYYIMNFERAHCIFGMNPDSNISIHIDLIEGYANKGYEILSFDFLYNNTVQYKNFRILNVPLDAVMLMLYKVIGCKELKDKYRQTIHTAYKNDPEKIQDLLIQVLGQHCGNQIFEYIKNSEYDKVINSSKQINNIAKKRTFLKKTLKTIAGIIYFLAEKSWRMIICPSRFQKTIAVEAPDGTGKTTFIDNLILEIAHFFVSDISKSRIYHFRPEILPNLGAVGEKARVIKQDKNFTVPHRAKPVGALSSFVRMTYYWLDYVIGMPLILRKNAQFDRITIFDRYIYDFLVDPYRSRIKLPYWLRCTFSKLVKQPKVVFVLDADAETIYARKQELTKEEINRQLIDFKKLSKMGKRVHLLDATQPPEQIANDAIKIVLDTFTKQL